MAWNGNTTSTTWTMRSGRCSRVRTTLPGSQVLLAFLFTVPLQTGFGELGDQERASFLVALLGAAVASVLLIAPTAHARVRFPSSGLRRRTMGHLRVAAWLALAGTVALAIAIGAAPAPAVLGTFLR